jgi:DNA polymerase III delta prime subunit
LRDFDEATPEAMNATLKILEEPPEYAIIFLIVKNPESLLETILSRSLNLYSMKSTPPLSSELHTYIDEYIRVESSRLLGYLYSMKLDREAALGILIALSRNAEKTLLSRIEEGIISLYNVNETPRNILDRILLSPREI